MKKYVVIVEHKIYKSTGVLSTLFDTKEQAEEEIKKQNNNEFNFYIKEIDILLEV